MKKTILNNNQGFSLVEVIVSMLIVAIGVLGLAPMFVLSVEGNVIARDSSVVTNLIKEQVEFYSDGSVIPAVPFSDLEAFPFDATGHPTTDSLGSGQSPSTNGNFLRTTYIADNSVDTLIPAGVYELVVSVTWTDNQNVQRHSSYTTYVLK